MKNFRIKNYIMVSLFILLTSINLSSSVNFKEQTENNKKISLLEHSRISIDKDLPKLTITSYGMEIDAKIEKQEGLWEWHKIKLTPGEHSSRITIIPAGEKETWTGNVSIWIVSFQKQKEKEISFELKNKVKILPIPPSPWKTGEIKRNIKLGEIKVDI